MIEFFDSHCHLDFDPLKKDIKVVVERAYKAGVKKMINVGTSLRRSTESIRISNIYPNVWASVGLHPHEVEKIESLEGSIRSLKSLAQNDKVVAIGEIGLDYFNLESEELKKKQKELFISQLNLAKELNFPTIIHTRDAERDTLKILSTIYRNQNSRSGVVHCFTGSSEFAQKLVDLGFSIGFTGFVTFEQSKFDHIKEVVKIVPLDKILIETDAPFLAPEPYRGKQNEPAYVVEVAKKISVIKNKSLQEIAKVTYKNTETLFVKTMKDGSLL